MSYIRRLIDYYRDNPEGYWFKPKLYGWGWMPVRWQGWAVVVAYIVAVLFFALTIDEQSPPREIAFTFILPLILLTATFITIAFKTGERPHWMWGPPHSDATHDEMSNRRKQQ